MICCVRQGTKYPSEYVQRLQAGVMRNLPAGHNEEFVCFTDREPIEGVRCEPLTVDLPGWWAKLHIFKIGKPLIYFDLDMVMIGSLKPLLEWDGFGIIRNPRFQGHGYNSSVMKLTGNEGHVWDLFKPDVMESHRGDQDWLNTISPHAPTFPAEWFPSWKVNMVYLMDGPPQGAIALNCHGDPKPADIREKWVQDFWLGNAA